MLGSSLVVHIEGQWAPHITDFQRNTLWKFSVCSVAGGPRIGVGQPATQGERRGPGLFLEINRSVPS